MKGNSMGRNRENIRASPGVDPTIWSDRPLLGLLEASAASLKAGQYRDAPLLWHCGTT